MRVAGEPYTLAIICYIWFLQAALSILHQLVQVDEEIL